MELQASSSDTTEVSNSELHVQGKTLSLMFMITNSNSFLSNLLSLKSGKEEKGKPKKSETTAATNVVKDRTRRSNAATFSRHASTNLSLSCQLLCLWLVDDVLDWCHTSTDQPWVPAEKTSECNDNARTEEKNADDEEEPPLTLRNDQPVVISLQTRKKLMKWEPQREKKTPMLTFQNRDCKIMHQWRHRGDTVELFIFLEKLWQLFPPLLEKNYLGQQQIVIIITTVKYA